MTPYGREADRIRHDLGTRHPDCDFEPRAHCDRLDVCALMEGISHFGRKTCAVRLGGESSLKGSSLLLNCDNRYHKLFFVAQDIERVAGVS